MNTEDTKAVRQNKQQMTDISINISYHLTQVWSLGWEDALEEEMEPYSRILLGRILLTKELGRLQSTGSQRVDHD